MKIENRIRRLITPARIRKGDCCVSELVDLVFEAERIAEIIKEGGDYHTPHYLSYAEGNFQRRKKGTPPNAVRIQIHGRKYYFWQ